MTEYHSGEVKLSGFKLDKLKSAAKHVTGITKIINRHDRYR